MAAGLPARRWGIAALLLVTLVWGTTFPAMKQLGAQLGVMEIILLRFVISSVIFIPLLRGLSPHEWRWGLSMGAVLFCAFFLQVTGLSQTTSNRNAFVTGLNVLIVPFLAFVLGQRIGWPLVLGALLGVLGLAGLYYEQAPWSVGDSITLASAFAYAVYVLTFEYAARSRTPLRPERIAAVQSWVMMVLSGLGFVTLEPATWSDLWSRASVYLPTLIYLGVVASAMMVWLQAWGQARVRAVEAAIIYGLEPVCAAVAAVWWIGETLTGRAMVGGAVIVLGVIVAQWPVASVQKKHVAD